MSAEGPGVSRSEGDPCGHLRRWLQVFLDDEIHDRRTVMRLAEHLDLCEKCTLEAQNFAQLKDCLRNLQPPADPIAVERLQSFLTTLGDRPDTALAP